MRFRLYVKILYYTIKKGAIWKTLQIFNDFKNEYPYPSRQSFYPRNYEAVLHTFLQIPDVCVCVLCEIIPDVNNKQRTLPVDIVFSRDFHLRSVKLVKCTKTSTQVFESNVRTFISLRFAYRHSILRWIGKEPRKELVAVLSKLPKNNKLWSISRMLRAEERSHLHYFIQLCFCIACDSKINTR